MSKKIIGIDLGGTSIKFAILTSEGEIQEKWSIKTNVLDEGSHIVEDMIESILHRLDLLQLSAEDFIGIGMGSPGVVDREKGLLSVLTISIGRRCSRSRIRLKKRLGFLSILTTMLTLLLWVNVGWVLEKTSLM